MTTRTTVPTTALVWFRRDLRLTDNPALHAALQSAERIVPVYIHDPDSEAPWSAGGATQSWLHHSLEALAADIAALGGRLILRQGRTLSVLRALARETGATEVYWNRLYEPAVVSRDTQIKAALREDGLTAESFNGALWREPWQIQTGGGTPYKVFTPFWKVLSTGLPEAVVLPPPDALKTPAKIASDRLDALELKPQIAWDSGFYDVWTPGESGALQQLGDFVDGAMSGYREARDLPAKAGVSRLSPHLHFGEISPRQALVATHRALRDREAIENDASHFLRELGWREFAHHLLHHFPTTPEQPMDPRFAQFPWRRASDYADDLAAWQRGRTGIPIVDAGMRQLWTTGWMHNRVRMIVASLLTKHLLIPWQEGARWFWDTLADADLANNTLGWQWVAGCGADAAPYFRVFNPVLQSRKFDSDGAYLRQWLPELRRADAKAIHEPWAHSRTLLASGIQLGRDYPLPIVDLAEGRQRALDAYAQWRTHV